MYLLLGGRGEGSVFFISVFLIYHKDETGHSFHFQTKKKKKKKGNLRGYT